MLPFKSPFAVYGAYLDWKPTDASKDTYKPIVQCLPMAERLPCDYPHVPERYKRKMERVDAHTF